MFTGSPTFPQMQHCLRPEINEKHLSMSELFITGTNTKNKLNKFDSLTITCKQIKKQIIKCTQNLEFFISIQQKHHNIQLTLFLFLLFSNNKNKLKTKGMKKRKSRKNIYILKKIVILVHIFLKHIQNYLFPSFEFNNIVFHKYCCVP